MREVSLQNRKFTGISVDFPMKCHWDFDPRVAVQDRNFTGISDFCLICNVGFPHLYDFFLIFFYFSMIVFLIFNYCFPLPGELTDLKGALEELFKMRAAGRAVS